jgi:DNA-binding NtrC family response regulator
MFDFFSPCEVARVYEYFAWYDWQFWCESEDAARRQASEETVTAGPDAARRSMRDRSQARQVPGDAGPIWFIRTHSCRGGAGDDGDPVHRLTSATNSTDLRRSVRRAQELLWQASAGQAPPEIDAASVTQMAWHSLRRLARDCSYPPEPEPPQSGGQAIRYLDRVVEWCDRHANSQACRNGGHDQESSAGEAAAPPDQDVPEEDLCKLRGIKKAIDPDNTFIGQSLPTLRVFARIEVYNRNSTKSVLICGVTGVGKTQVGLLIHSSSDRGKKGYHREQAANNKSSDFGIITARWAGIGENSGLNNAAKGSSPGILEACAGGTIFLDEVHETTLEFQLFLHDILDGRPIPVAAGKAPPVEPKVRMIFGTNVDLEQKVREGTLRHDFYRRIKARVLEIPPLARRKDDIFLFIQHWCKGYRVTPAARLCLLEYDWPGNVGELQEVLELAKDEVGPGAKVITPNQLSALRDSGLVAAMRKLSHDEADKRLFLVLWETLIAQGWRPGRRGRALQTQLAGLMGVSPATITRRAREYIGPKALPAA